MCSMSVERDIRYDLIARLCPNATGAELKSVATEVSRCVLLGRLRMVLTTRPVCLRFELEERSPRKETSWMPLRRSSDKAPSSPVRLSMRSTTRREGKKITKLCMHIMCRDGCACNCRLVVTFLVGLAQYAS